MSKAPDDDQGGKPRDATGAEEDDAGPDSAAMRALLRRALAPDAPTAEAAPAAKPPPRPKLLPGIQRKIRKRSRGKFFADGWSITQSRINYGLVATVMLVLLALTYVALGPMGISAP